MCVYDTYVQKNRFYWNKIQSVVGFDFLLFFIPTQNDIFKH